MQKRIGEFLLILQVLQRVNAEFPLQYIVCLSEIAVSEGLSLTSLSCRTGMPLSTVSRIVGALSQPRKKGMNYGLVRVVVSPSERRKKELYLTPRGRSILTGIVDILDARAA